MKTKILYCAPSITKDEVKEVTIAATSGWGENAYKYIALFENTFKSYLGTKFAIATSSCTGALHMGLYAIGIQPGDEIILADTNWIATVAPICHLGAVPIFVDILPDTWCIDPNAVIKAITKKTKAIVATHLYGNLCEMSELLKISKQYNIPLIEDAAEAIGSEYHGQKAGSMGLFGVFSFHGSKTITCGEGGMFVTSDEALYEKVLMVSNHGRSRFQKRQFWPEVIGFKYKMSNIQAALGYVQMQRIEDLVLRKREILQYYRDRILFSMNLEKSGEKLGAWMPTVVFESSCGKVDDILELFKSENIDVRPFFYPLSSLPMFKKKKENTYAYDINSRALNLPSYHDLSNEDQDRVIAVCNRLNPNSRK